MSILDIKTNLSEAFRKTGFSKSAPFESKSPPKQGEYPQLLPNEVAKEFSIGNPVSSPEISIGKARGSLKISDFSQGDIFHTQPYVDTPIRAEVQFPLTQIKNHRIRIGSFLDSNEGQLFITNQSLLQQYNAMPESFDGSSARGGVYKVYKSDNRVFSPFGIRGSLQPGFHIERHKINRSTKEDAFGRFVSDGDGSRSSFLTENFPNLAPNKDRVILPTNEKQEGALVRIGSDLVDGFAKRFEPLAQNKISSIVEQAFLNPRKLKIQKVGPTFKSIAAQALGGSLGDLIGAGSRKLVDRGRDFIGGLFGGLNANISLGSGPVANGISNIVNAGLNIAIDTASVFAQQSFAEAVVQQTNQAGVYVGKILNVDPKFVTNSIQASFAQGTKATISQTSPTSNLNKYNIYAPYAYKSNQIEEASFDRSKIWVKDDGVSKIAAYKGMRIPDNDTRFPIPFIHVSRLSLISDEPNIKYVNPDKLFRNEGRDGDYHRQIEFRTLPYTQLMTKFSNTGIGEFHPAGIADKNSLSEFLKDEKASTLGDYGVKLVDEIAEDAKLGRWKSSRKSDKVTIHRPHHDDNNLRDDFVPFAFHDVYNKKHIQFRAILGAITDTVRPEYDPIRYLGRADQVYIYKGAIRNINFTFKYAAFTKQELVVGWEKLNYLVGLAYPSGYESGRMVTPLIELTLGGMFDRAPGLINNISLTVTDQSPWDINPEFELPKYVEASVDFQYIGKYPIKGRGKHYGLKYMVGDGENLTSETDGMLTDVQKAAKHTPPQSQSERAFNKAVVEGEIAAGYLT